MIRLMIRFVGAIAVWLPGLMSALAAQQPIPSPHAPADATHGLDATAVATQEYLKTGQARAVQMGDTRAFPYGKSQPTLTCAPLRTCLIRLQAGEAVLGPPALGDSERWITGLMATGPSGATPVVYVKPVACNLTTNIVISTDRHLYNVILDAPPCPSKGAENRRDDAYTWQLMFYYPDETRASWTPSTLPGGPLAPGGSGVRPEQLNFAYQIKKDKHFPWTPSQVFDDGLHTYIKLPPKAQRTAAPVLFVLTEDDRRTILNYTLSHDFYVTDRVFHRAVLVIAEEGKERQLTLVNTTPSAQDGR